MDLVFMGTPPFAATILAALIRAGHSIRAVYTQPPRPVGRGHRLQPSPVQLSAERHAIAVRTPARLRDPGVVAEFAALGAEAGVVAAYGLILPPPILAAPRIGCLNVHASLLPRWRGAAPVQHALLAGDAATGVTIMLMDEGLDTGPIVLQRACPISADATTASLTTALAQIGSELIVEALDKAARGILQPRPQPPCGVTYAPRIRRADGRLDWRRAAAELERRVRALDPWPGAFFLHRDEAIRVLAATVVTVSPSTPGTVLDERLTIACGAGALRPLRVQRSGRAALDTAAFLRGYPIVPGTQLPCPVTS